MHVLTKIFIVLVSLLAVFLVPLVVVYAHNENSFQKRYQAAEAQAAAYRATFESAKASHGADMVRKETQIQELDEANSVLQRQVDRQDTEVRSLESRLVEAEALDAQIRTQLTTLVNAVDAGQQLTDTLIDDLRGIRKDYLAAERERVELDEALRDSLAKLDAADEARRALQEELQRVKDEYARSLDTLHHYVAQYGSLSDRGATVELGGLAPDRDLDATVLNVRRSSDQTYAEIDAGSRDGVKEGWVMTIGAGGKFVARIRIVSVDIDRSTGIVELEDPNYRGQVQEGQQVHARTPQ